MEFKTFVFQYFVILILRKIFACPSGKLSTEFTSPIAKSTSPRLSDMTFFAHWSKLWKALALQQNSDEGPTLELSAAFQIFHGSNSTFRARVCVLRLFLRQGLWSLSKIVSLRSIYLALTVMTLSDPYFPTSDGGIN